MKIITAKIITAKIITAKMTKKAQKWGKVGKSGEKWKNAKTKGPP